jgi:general stress protein 26
MGKTPGFVMSGNGENAVLYNEGTRGVKAKRGIAVSAKRVNQESPALAWVSFPLEIRMETRMSDETERDQNVKKLAQMIKGIDFGMLTTVDDAGTLRSRPMSVNGNVEFDGSVWFFTFGSSHKVLEAQHHPQVAVSFSDPKNQNYVSLSGTAELVRDKAKIEELWTPSLKSWFPQGVDTPDIALLHVTAHKGEYWDAPASAVAHIFGLVKSLATGQPALVGEDKKVTLD